MGWTIQGSISGMDKLFFIFPSTFWPALRPDTKRILGYFFHVKSGRSVRIATYPHLTPRLRTEVKNWREWNSNRSYTQENDEAPQDLLWAESLSRKNYPNTKKQKEMSEMLWHVVQLFRSSTTKVFEMQRNNLNQNDWAFISLLP
jgi:hypothetical protein